MSALDTVLETYRDNFGVKTDRANEIHRDACIEVAALRNGERVAALVAECDALKEAMINIEGHACIMMEQTDIFHGYNDWLTVRNDARAALSKLEKLK